MKLYFYATCPYSNAVRILTKHCISNIKEIQISSRSMFLNLNIDKLPALYNETNYYYDVWPIIIYLKENHAKYIIDIFFRQIDQMNFASSLNELYIDIYYLYLAHDVRLYGKTPLISLNSASNKLQNYLKKYNSFLKGKYYLFNQELSVCDILLFSFISSYEYFNIINWRDYNFLFEWYLRCKSLKELNFILQSEIDNYPPLSPLYKLDYRI